MDTNIRFKVGYQVDKTGLNEIKASLQQLQQLTASDLMSLNKGMKLSEAQTQLKEIQTSINQISTALQSSFNSKLGTLNVTKFNEELRKIDLNKVYKDFNAMGVQGQIAFRNITTEALTTNMKLKQTHSVLDSIAVTLRNTAKWTLASTALNTFTGSVQQAYGYVKNLDSSLNDIRIVTQKSADDMADFAVQANKAATALGKSTTDYTNASLIYYQQGKI